MEEAKFFEGWRGVQDAGTKNLQEAPFHPQDRGSDLTEDEVTATWICSLLVASELAGSCTGTGL